MTLILEIFFIGLILSADSFSAAIAMGHRPFTKNDALKFAFSSGGAEAFTTLIGSMAGTQIIKKFGDYDHWIAFFLLLGVALHMAFEGINQMRGEEQTKKVNFHSFLKVLIVSFATSLDAFGVGIGLGVAQKPIIPFLVSIGLWAFAATIGGLYLSRRLSKKFGPIMTLFGSLVLGILAFQMLKI
jgi:manganese efflux pump family protein